MFNSFVRERPEPSMDRLTDYKVQEKQDLFPAHIFMKPSTVCADILYNSGKNAVLGFGSRRAEGGRFRASHPSRVKHVNTRSRQPTERSSFFGCGWVA